MTDQSTGGQDFETVAEWLNTMDDGLAYVESLAALTRIEARLTTAERERDEVQRSFDSLRKDFERVVAERDEMRAAEQTTREATARYYDPRLLTRPAAKHIEARLTTAERERDEAREALVAVRSAYLRCSPSAAWSIVDDLKRGTPPHSEYPVQHLRRLYAELSVLFGGNPEDRLASGEIPSAFNWPPESVPYGLANRALTQPEEPTS